MKYRLGLKEITEDDVNAQCPFMPEPEDYQMYVAAKSPLVISRLAITSFALNLTSMKFYVVS